MSTEKNKEEAFSNFINKEYSTIANAHFNVSQRITSFFQYMLAIYAAPLVLFNSNIKIDDTIKGIVFIFISFIGFFVCMYANQLRCESLLYSRTVNATRAYSYDMSNNIILEKYQVLPIQKNKPPFIDHFQFIWIVLTAAVTNAGYFIYGIMQLKPFIKEIFLKRYATTEIMSNLVETISFLVVFSIIFIIQYCLYHYLTRKVEFGLNLYKQRIGIDIDGVIGYHEKSFCEMYNQKFRNDSDDKIEIIQITQIPVNKIAGLNITEEQERNIFNDENYWRNMVEIPNAAKTIQKIHNTFGLDVYIFSWRPWGKKVDEHCSKKFDIKDITEKWLAEKGIYKKKINSSKREKEIEKEVAKVWVEYNNTKDQDKRDELKKKIKEIEKPKYLYKKLYIEKGNYNLPVGIKGSLFKNRFFYSQELKIKYFVEDEPAKAKKLSDICKYVFLLEHPYNKNENDLPYNVIKVKSWEEIFDKIKILN